jgi:hypothetical protein
MPPEPVAGPSLRELQQWMQSRIRPAGPAVLAPPPRFNLQRGVPGTERLTVYAVAYLARTQQALEEVYPAIRRVLGAGAFGSLSRGYIERHPSREYNLSFIGRHLPEFLRTHRLAERLPFLPDLASLEWRVCEAFHAFEQPAMDAQPLGALSLDAWERTQLILQPSVGLLASAWPVVDIWTARHQPDAAVDIPLLDRPQHALIFRQALTVRCEVVEPLQFLVLERLLAGRTLGEACRDLTAQAGDRLPPLEAWFSRWVQEGLIVRCQTTAA